MRAVCSWLLRRAARVVCRRNAFSHSVKSGVREDLHDLVDNVCVDASFVQLRADAFLLGTERLCRIPANARVKGASAAQRRIPGDKAFFMSKIFAKLRPFWSS